MKWEDIDKLPVAFPIINPEGAMGKMAERLEKFKVGDCAGFPEVEYPPFSDACKGESADGAAIIMAQAGIDDWSRSSFDAQPVIYPPIDRSNPITCGSILVSLFIAALCTLGIIGVISSW